MAPPRSRHRVAGRRVRGSRWGSGTLALAALATTVAAACGVPAGEVAAPAPGETTAPPTTEVRTVPDAVDGALRARVPEPAGYPDDFPDLETLLFGDSVALLVADDLARASRAPLTVDAVDCRRLDAGFTGPCGGVPAGAPVASGLADLVEVATGLEEPGRTVAVVIIANNAALERGDVEAAMDALGDLHRVWWVTARVGRGWQDANNELIAQVVPRRDNGGVIDWYAASTGHEWLADHVHPDETGQAALADLVTEHLDCDCTP